MSNASLAETAQAMVAPGKGILAADESAPTIGKRFASIGVESTEPLRRDYRSMLFSTPGAEQFISGVILFDETLRQSMPDGEPMPQYLAGRGMIPGIKVDQGAKPLAGFPGEKITEGLDGLRERLAEYRGLGAGFAKWRAVIAIGEGAPSDYCVHANAHALARYAALCQEAGLVPIVEPEVLMDGPHPLSRCEQVTGEVLAQVFDELERHRVELEGIILKPNMVVSGSECPAQAGVDEVAEATLRALKTHVPAAVPGIAFLSGGQSAEDATAHLSAMNARGPHPWQVSFSYGRALQAPALTAWGGKAGRLAEAQQAFGERARLNGLARTGGYRPELEAA
ncbi:MAG: fructose-bisphosphate aldolase class I [Gammaproteobacteria bacterium]|nr:fructose-bisphosphate aldolase class I [Gammaproteobacteria bacterium]